MYRVLKPGRVACIHTKDRIQYGTMTGTGMYSVNEFSDKTVAAFKRHGWLYMGRIVIDTDVVRENNQSYRLGWSENCQDSSKMGCGSNEYVLLFRKWNPSMSPNQTANGPEPVRKDKEDYTRAKWQIDATGTWRSSGDELVSPQMLAGMSMSDLYRWWRQFSVKHGYDLATHQQITEEIDRQGRLPATMMLFAPVAHNPDVWTDILRINTLNTELARKKNDSHVCPLQLDVIERLIRRFSNPGDIVADPFNGVGSVTYQAIKMDRIGWGIELSTEYWKYQVAFNERAERELRAPTLFDVVNFQQDYEQLKEMEVTHV
jgi:DNA modification methylase